MSGEKSASLMNAVGPEKNEAKIKVGHQNTGPAAAPLMVSGEQAVPPGEMGAGPSGRPVHLAAREESIKWRHARSKSASNRPLCLLPAQDRKQGVKRKLFLHDCEDDVECEITG